MIFLTTLLKATIAAVMLPIAIGLGAFVGVTCFLAMWFDLVWKKVICD